MAAKLLANQLKSLMNDPVEGFTVELLNDSSLYEWKIYLEGPSDTCYEGGVFQLLLSFPKDYPMSPPTLRFLSEFWHPNVYVREGRVCISILHPPGEDILSGELPQERWLPTQSVTTIILSLMSILSDPNCSSPANVDASVEWRSNREAYKKRCAKLVEKANKLKPSHIVIPHPDTNPEEHRKYVEKIKRQDQGVDMDYLQYSDNYYDDDDDDEDDDDDDNDDENNDDNSEIEDDEVVESQDVVTVPEPKINENVEDNNTNNNNNNCRTSVSDIIISDSPQTKIQPESSEDNTTTTTTTISPPTETIPNIATPIDTNTDSSPSPTTTATVPPVNNNETSHTTVNTNISEDNNNTNTNVLPPNNNSNNNNNNNNNNNRRKKKSKKCILM